MSKPLFEERADRTLDKVRAVYAQRGGEYADTWRTCRFLAMKATAKKLGLVIPDEYCRALATAAFYDMKYERLSGGYKDDSVIDAIAYGSFWIDEMVDLDGPKENLFAGFKPRIKPEPEQQYRMLDQGETILGYDEYKNNGGDWIVTGCAGTSVLRHEVGRYRRPIKPMEIGRPVHELNYRNMEIGEVVSDGDIFNSKPRGGWVPASDIGGKVTETNQYRRPINPQENAVK